ncbi:heme-binding protein 1-like [Magallana gigas]|uniref:heme-binding protein 1-like n=1 Tax=Magallana gigas TaxID=29159 RepID=UPI003341C2C5
MVVDTLRQIQEYEPRQYSASSWMSTNTAGVDYSKASSTNFMRLFRYISGTYDDNIKEWIKEAIKLGQAIGDTSKYHTEFSYTAGYDSPFRFLNRHNEIWFIAKQQ